MLRDWISAARELHDVKSREMELRLALVVLVFGEKAAKIGGTRREPVTDTQELKLEVRRAAKVDPAKIGGALKKLSQLVGAVKGKLLGERLISWKPSASLKELEALTDEQRAVFDGVISIELSSPSLELVDIKPPAK